MPRINPAKASLLRPDPSTLYGARLADERELGQILKGAEAFWQTRMGRTVDPGLYVASSLFDPSDGVSPDARGIGTVRGFEDDRIYFSGDYVGRQLKRIRSGKSARGRRRAVQDLYSLTAHELGHLLGQEHPADPAYHGVMAEDGSRRDVPGDWRPLARQVLGDRYFNPRLWRKTADGRWVRRGT